MQTITSRGVSQLGANQTCRTISTDKTQHMRSRPVLNCTYNTNGCITAEELARARLQYSRRALIHLLHKRQNHEVRFDSQHYLSHCTPILRLLPRTMQTQATAVNSCFAHLPSFHSPQRQCGEPCLSARKCSKSLCLEDGPGSPVCTASPGWEASSDQREASSRVGSPRDGFSMWELRFWGASPRGSLTTLRRKM